MTLSGPKNQSNLLRIAPTSIHIRQREKIDDYGKKVLIGEKRKRQRNCPLVKRFLCLLYDYC